MDFGFCVVGLASFELFEVWNFPDQAWCTDSALSSVIVHRAWANTGCALRVRATGPTEGVFSATQRTLFMFEECTKEECQKPNQTTLLAVVPCLWWSTCFWTTSHCWDPLTLEGECFFCIMLLRCCFTFSFLFMFRACHCQKWKLCVMQLCLLRT